MTVPKIPTYAEVASKLTELEVKYEILGKRYDTLTALLRKQGKDRVVYEPEFGKLGEVWDDERVDIIGQNGNDGLHYRRLEAYCDVLYDDDLDKEGM